MPEDFPAPQRCPSRSDESVAPMKQADVDEVQDCVFELHRARNETAAKLR
jgi:hypothetical protein